jgi:hypothetical protein
LHKLIFQLADNKLSHEQRMLSAIAFVNLLVTKLRISSCHCAAERSGATSPAKGRPKDAAAAAFAAGGAGELGAQIDV